jgi:Flp pilus assembly protein protease CpaA
MCLNYYSSIAPFLLAALLLLLLLQLQLLLLTVVVMMVMVNVLVVVLLLLELVGACTMTLPSMVEATTSTAALGLVLGELGFALDGLGGRCRQDVLGIIELS